MKILFYNHTNQVSGAEKVLLLLLARLGRDRFETVLLCPGEGKLQSNATSVGVQCKSVDPLEARFTWRPDRLLRYLTSFVSVVRQVRARVKECSPELIHANSIRAGLVISTATIGLGIPIVWHVHDLLPAHAISTLIRFFVLLVPPARIVAVSRASGNSLRGDLLRRFPARVKVTTIHNAVEKLSDSAAIASSQTRGVAASGPGVPPMNHAQDARAQPHLLRRELRVRATDPLIGIVGSLTPGKGQLELITAFAGVLKRIPDAVLLVVGSAIFNRGDGYRERLLGEARALGILDRVKFMEQRDDVPAIMRSLDLLVLNSKSEACPLVVLEGLACGVPVLSTAVGGVPELITHRETGWLVPAGDERKLAHAIVSLVQLPKMRARLVANGRRYVETNFTVEKFMTQWEALYADLSARVMPSVSSRELTLMDRPQTNSLRYISTQSSSSAPWSRVAVFHDNFAQMGGAEKVAEEIHGLLPGATLHSTVALPEILSDGLRQARIRTSWMQRLPGLKRHFRHYFLFYPFAVESVDLSKYDLIVSSCFGYAKGVRKRRGAIHVCYCHTPMRWVWRYEDYSARAGFRGLTRRLLPLLLSVLKRWDLRASRQPDYFIANSHVVAERIKKFYGRDSIVIPPPIDVKRFCPASLDSLGIAQETEPYYLVLSRLVPYKRIDLAVEACTRLKRKLIVIGDGPDRARLEKLAGPTVRFLGRQTDDAVVSYASGCRALLFPGEEDFGMTPLEVNATGRPVIAFRAGGALETVVEGVTGLFFDQPTSAALAQSIEEFERCSWDSSELKAHAAKFDRTIFAERLLAFLRQVAPEAKLTQELVWQRFAPFESLETTAASFSRLRSAGN